MSNISLVLLDKAWADEHKKPTRIYEPIITITRNAILLNRSLITAMGLKSGDFILLANDRQVNKDFYIMSHPRGFKLNVKRHGDGSISCGAYFKTICTVLGLDEKSTSRLKFKVAEKPDAINGFRCFAINTLRPLLPAPADQSGDKGAEQGATHTTA